MFIGTPCSLFQPKVFLVQAKFLIFPAVLVSGMEEKD